MAAVEDSPEWIFRPVLDEFIEAFKDWVDSIDIAKAGKVRELPVECKYLTFNYTETLEVIYGIPASNILHIHGSRILDNEYIIGHNNFRNPNEAYNDESHNNLQLKYTPLPSIVGMAVSPRFKFSLTLSFANPTTPGFS